MIFFQFLYTFQTNFVITNFHNYLSINTESNFSKSKNLVLCLQEFNDKTINLVQIQYENQNPASFNALNISQPF